MRIQSSDGKASPSFTVEGWRQQWDDATPERRARMSAEVRDGTLVDDDGTALDPRVAQRVKDRLLGTFGHLPPTVRGRRPEREPLRWLIHGVWPWGTKPMLGGNPKAGKTTVMADLVAALLAPGERKFLGRFDVEVPHDDWWRGVVFINAETPPGAMEEALDPGTDDEGWMHLTIEHLEDLGGAGQFDLTDPVLYDLWAQRLAECDVCDGSDESTPFVVIVDGLTAILADAGKGVEHYGLWYAAFRRLMNELDVPNALVVAHNTLQGGHLMGGTEAQAGADGLWTYAADRQDDPRSVRRFSVRPRLGGEAVGPLRVDLDEHGRPRVAKQATEPTKADPVADENSVEAVARRTADYVREHPGAGGQELTDNVEAWSKERNLEGRQRALDDNLIREVKCGSACLICTKPHHRRSHYWIVE